MKRLVWLLLSGVLPLQAEESWSSTPHRTAWIREGREVVAMVHPMGAAKSFLHPLTLPSGAALTAFEPADHPWHRGLWWSWKYINRVNFWEEDRLTRRSEGQSELIEHRFDPEPDGSGRFTQRLVYRKPDGPVWLDESRRLHIAPVGTAGAYRIDWSSVFTAQEAVRLDRTPPSPKSAKGGSGGYAGLALRLAPMMKTWTYRAHGRAETGGALHGERARWVQGEGPEGAFLFIDHPSNPGSPVAWRVTPDMPFVSPSPLFAAPRDLAAGEVLSYRYRLVVLPAALAAAEADRLADAFAAE